MARGREASASQSGSIFKKRWPDGHWWLRFSVQGKRDHREPTNPRTYDEEEAWRQLRARQALHPHERPAVIVASTATVNDLLDLLVEDYANKGQTLQQGRAEAWRAALGPMRALDVQLRHIEGVMKAWCEKGIAWPGRDPKRVVPTTRANTVTYIPFLRRAYSLGRMHFQLMTPLVFPSTKRKRRNRYHPPSSWTAIRDVIAAGRGCGPVLAEAMELDQIYGIRKVMLRTLEVRHVRPVSEKVWRITIPGEETKNGEPYDVALVGRALEIVQAAWARRLPNCPYLFHYHGRRLPDPRYRLKAACEQLGIPYGRNVGLVFHDLRHAAVTTLQATRTGTAVGMSITGHQDVKVYTDYNATFEDAQIEAILRAEQYLKDKQAADGPFKPTVVSIAGRGR